MTHPECSKSFKYAVVSDVHLGHRRTKTHHILQNLRKAFNLKVGLPGLDVLFIAGDLFDGLLNHSSDEASDIHLWMISLLRDCRALNVKVRVLEGTPSHDYGQNRWFIVANQALAEPADLLYVDKVDIEYMPEWDLQVLYVPDKWRYEAEDTYREILELMRSRALTQVDIAIMHGSFDYQMPKSPGVHDSEQYLAIVKHYVTIGHVHTHSTYKEKIIAQGSFDRTAQGEEEPKGYVRVQLFPNQWEFVENVWAKLYKTIELRGMEIDAALQVLQSLPHYPDDTYLRLLVDRNGSVQRALETIRDAYPRYNIQTQATGKADSVEALAELDEDALEDEAITISRSNIQDLILAELPVVDPAVKAALLEIMGRAA